jgi:putative heme-binding domain-containing protein
MMGPDLANLIHRDYHSVLRDVRQPSFAINPDYTSQIVALKDGRVLTGVLITKDDQLLIGNEQAELTRLNPAQIESMTPTGISAMPKDLTDKLTAEQLRDLMTYLLTPPPQMPLDGPLTAPPLRTRAEVAALLAGAEVLPETLDSLRITLVAGPKDHGPGEHDYPAWQLQWAQLLAAAEAVEVDTAWEFPSDEQLARADVLIFFQKGAWNDDRAKKLDAWQRRGGGAVYVHWAVNGDERADEFAERIGLASRGGSIRFRHGPLTLNMHSTDHPIMRNMETMQLYDESYWLLSGERRNIRLLASSTEDGEAHPQVWTYERGDGRVFVSIPGHYSWTFDDPLFRTLLLRGIAWTAHQGVDRFNDLVPLGARMTR